MRVYQIEARGFVACLNGSPHAIVSKEIYTSQPGDSEKEKFRRKCIGGRGLRDLDPKKDIFIRIIQYDLIDNGGFYKGEIMKQTLVVGPIVLDIWPAEPNDADSPMCGHIVKCICQDKEHSGTVFSGRIDGIESLVLAHACGGVDVENTKYIQGIQTAIDACLNQE